MALTGGCVRGAIEVFAIEEVDSAVVIGGVEVVVFGAVVDETTVPTGSPMASGSDDFLLDCDAEPITMSAPRIQIQTGAFRNFFLNHLVFSIATEGGGGGRKSLIAEPFKGAAVSC